MRVFERRDGLTPLAAVPVRLSQGTPSRVRRAHLKWNCELVAVKELGVATWIWLGVRDDFRNWVVTAA
jgi:hypothetical protein